MAPVSAPSAGPERAHRWVGAAGVTLLTVALLLVGMANVGIRLTAPEGVDDGVRWARQRDRLVAIEVAAGSPAAQAGVRPGDAVVQLDAVPIRDLEQLQAVARGAHAGQAVAYTLTAAAGLRVVSVVLSPALPTSPLYYLLALVGALAILVGAAVRVRRPRDPATLHFYWLCVAVFGACALSYTGALDPLDWTFYWGDALATALLPPLLWHFVRAFPAATALPSRRVAPLVAIYVPAVILVGARLTALTAAPAMPDAAWHILDGVDRAEPVYLAVCGAGALLTLWSALRSTRSATVHLQLRWMVWGAAVGVGPYVVGYGLPWAIGVTPPDALGVTALALGAVPVSCACAIVRYRLRDVEVIVKRTFGYLAFAVASALLYLALQRAVGVVFGDASDTHTRVVALLATITVVLLAQPVQQALQTTIDRWFYRGRYDYRRALVGFARDLNRDLDVLRLSERLMDRIAETLDVSRMAVLLAERDDADYTCLVAAGLAPEAVRVRRDSALLTQLGNGQAVLLDDPFSPGRLDADGVTLLDDDEVHLLVPCVFEGHVIAIMALGPKATGEPYHSEDIALLAAVAGQVATAFENGRLYRQLAQKADEIGRMRAFNDDILESLNAGLVVFDEDGRVLRWNHAIEAMTGVTRDGALGRAIDLVLEPSIADALRAAAGQAPLPVEAQVLPATGGTDGPLTLRATAVPLHASGPLGVEGGTIVVLENVTEQRRLEEQLLLSQKMASIGVLAAGVAHEVNTPLTGISTYTQLLLEQLPPTDPQRPVLASIEQQTFRASRIVNSLLSLAHPGQAVEAHEPVDLHPLIREVCAQVEQLPSTPRVRVRCELGDEALVVGGVAYQLQQVLLNLCLNARDAMPGGGWITVATARRNGQALLTVTDTGSGIPPEQVPRIYEPFFTTKPVGQGTGLGLAISYGIVRDHRGAVHCDSTLGQGTTFTVTLPIWTEETAGRLAAR